MKETRYTKIVLSLALGLLALVATINFTTNPLGMYGPGKAFPAATAYARLYKIEAVKRERPDVIITGSSRADIGLNPREEFFPGMRPYNFALSAATIYEQRRTLEFAQAVHPLKKAIITLDLFTFNALKVDNKQFDPERLSPESLHQPRAFFDTYGTVFSLDTLLVSLKHRRYIKRLERYSYSKPNGHKLHNDGAWTAAHKGAFSMFDKPPAEGETGIGDFSFAYSGKPGDTVFQHLDAMLDLSRKNNIDVILLISPVHETELRRMPKALQEEWKRKLVERVRANAYKYNTKPYPLWDFATFNSITTENIPPRGDTKTQMKWFWDTNHYKEELGYLIFKKILGLPGKNTYPDFGVRLL